MIVACSIYMQHLYVSAIVTYICCGRICLACLMFLCLVVFSGYTTCCLHIFGGSFVVPPKNIYISSSGVKSNINAIGNHDDVSGSE